MVDIVNQSLFVVLGRARWTKAGQSGEQIAVILRAADDDDAVRQSLDALSAQGYAGAELDKVGVLSGTPEDEPYKSAAEDALQGHVSIVRLR